MNDNFTIGSTPIPEGNLCNLKFHQYIIYDSENWTQSGVLRWNATTKSFEVLPDPPSSFSSFSQSEKEREKENEEIINNSFLQSKNESNVNSKKIIIPKKNK